MLDTRKSSHISEWKVLQVEWGNEAFERSLGTFAVTAPRLLAANVAAKHLDAALQLVARLD